MTVCVLWGYCDGLFPTYHTMMRKCISWSRLWYGILLRITEHQRLGQGRSLRWIQIRGIILHWRRCLPQQNSKVNSSLGEESIFMNNDWTFWHFLHLTWIMFRSTCRLFSDARVSKVLICYVNQNNWGIRATTAFREILLVLPITIIKYSIYW